MLEVKVINKSRYDLPKYATKGSAGVDLKSNENDAVLLKSFENTLIHTGIYIELPFGYEAQVRPRSGLSIKHQIGMLNAPGTIDSDYRGEICVNLYNFSQKPFIIHPGDRIAQMVVSKCEQINWIPVEELSNSDRGDNGFGHTGLK